MVENQSRAIQRVLALAGGVRRRVAKRLPKPMRAIQIDMGSNPKEILLAVDFGGEFLEDRPLAGSWAERRPNRGRLSATGVVPKAEIDDIMKRWQELRRRR